MYEQNDDAAKAEAIKKAYAFAKTKYTDLKTNKVEPLFKKYDADGSGAIDKGELSSLCKDLGVPLDDA
jgi:Ca2+-binding EF-hand superfamily protein|tara:strand:+ start:536 stop:739 length:204 start_codon:yes stop_codon:yes gene_type:complete